MKTGPGNNQSITVQGGDTDQIPFMSDGEKECE